MSNKKDGIFSLIDEKNFSYRNYNNETDHYTYKIDKIFNYDSYLFVLFSKLYLENKLIGDSVTRNHLYLITIEKNGREITDTTALEKELFELIDNNKVVDLYAGKYKATIIINNSAFNATISKITSDPAEGNPWARVYRKLKATSDLTEVSFKKINTNLNDTVHIIDDEPITITNEKDEYTYADIDQFITLYHNIPTNNGTIDMYGTNSGRIGINNITSNTITEEERAQLTNINDSNRMLYNYEYYWDSSIESEDYSVDMKFFNQFLYNRDYNDNTLMGDMNTLKIFPYYEKNYFGGLTVDGRTSTNIHNYTYKDKAFITDCLLTTNIDDNYINFKSLNACTSQESKDIPIVFFNPLLMSQSELLEVDSKLIYREDDKIIDNYISTDYKTKTAKYMPYSLYSYSSKYNTSGILQYIDITAEMTNVLTSLEVKNYLQPIKVFYNYYFLYDPTTHKLEQRKLLSKIHFNNEDIKIETDFDWVNASISKITINETTVNIEHSTIEMNYRLAFFTDSFNEILAGNNIFILPRLDPITYNDLLDDKNSQENAMVCYIEEVDMSSVDNSTLPFYTIKQYVYNSADHEWTLDDDIIMMIIPKDSNCNIKMNNLRMNVPTTSSNISGCRVERFKYYDPNEIGVWAELDKQTTDETFFYMNNPLIKKDTKTFINATSVDNVFYNTNNTTSVKYTNNTSVYNIERELNDLYPNVSYDSQLVNFNNFGKDNKYKNTSLPAYLVDIDGEGTFYDGRLLYNNENDNEKKLRNNYNTTFENIVNHYMTVPGRSPFDRFEEVLKELNPLFNINKTYLYLISKGVNCSGIYYNTSGVINTTTDTLESDKYFILDRINISNLKEFSKLANITLENIEDITLKTNYPIYYKFEDITIKTIANYYQSLLELLIRISADDSIELLFTNNEYDMSTTIMNSLTMKTSVKPFESINAAYILSRHYFYDGAVSIKDLITFGIRDNHLIYEGIYNEENKYILRNKFIKSSREIDPQNQSDHDFVEPYYWTDTNMKQVKNNNPFIVDTNRIYSRGYNFNEFESNGVPKLNAYGISEGYFRSQKTASEYFEDNNISCLINVNLADDVIEIYHTKHTITETVDHTLLLNPDIPAIFLDEVKNNASTNSITNQTFMELAFSGYGNSGSSSCKICATLLAQVAVLEQLDKFYLVDRNNKMCVYIVEYTVNGSTSSLRITKLMNEAKVVDIIANTYYGKLDINLTNMSTTITTPTTTVPDLGLRTTYIKDTGKKYITINTSNLSYRKLITQSYNNTTIDKIKAARHISIITPNNEKVYFLDPDKDFIGFVRFEDWGDVADKSNWVNYIKPEDALPYKVAHNKEFYVAGDESIDYMYVNILDESTITQDDIRLSSKNFIEDYLLNRKTYITYYTKVGNDIAYKSINKDIDENFNKYVMAVDSSQLYITTNDNYVDHLIGTSTPSETFYMTCRYGKVYANFDLNSITEDENFKNFFNITGYRYLPYTNFYSTKFIFVDDSNSSRESSKQIAVLKNNGIVTLDAQQFLLDPDTAIFNFKFLHENNDIYKYYTTFEDKLYAVDGHKKTLSNAPKAIYEIAFDENNLLTADINVYMTNEEIDVKYNYIDYLNLLDNNIPFYKINYNYSSNNEDSVPNYVYYAYSVNNTIVIVRTVLSAAPSAGYAEIMAVLKFEDNIILTGTDTFIMAIQDKWTYDLEDKKYRYKTAYSILKYEDIMQNLYENLNSEKSSLYNITTNLTFKNNMLVLKDTLIDDTSIIDENKSDYYNTVNQTVITDNLLEINNVTLYNIHKFAGSTSSKEEYRIFVCSNGRILVSNTIFNNTNETVEMVDFYTINGRVNNIYMETCDVDNNDIMCVASDKNELYIFKNLFKVTNPDYANEYEKYFGGELTKTSLKYKYNFNNEAIDLKNVTPDDERSAYYRETLTPTILNIGSSIDDISVCEQYLNTLNKSLINVTDNKIEFVNSIKYFKLLSNAFISNDINIDNNSINTDGTDDEDTYIKLENVANTLNIENTDKATFLNMRVNINNKNIPENDRYYEFDYQLISTSTPIDPDDYVFNEHNLVKNSVIFEENDIYKNVYVYMPRTLLEKGSFNFMKDENDAIIKRNEKTYLINYKNVLDPSFDNSIVENYANIIKNNTSDLYSIPAKLNYKIIDNYFPNNANTYTVTKLPYKFNTRDYFIANINNGIEDINRLYFRWRYIGDLPINKKTTSSDPSIYDDDEVKETEYDYYVLSYIRKGYDNEEINEKTIIKDVSKMLKGYLSRTFDASYSAYDFMINKLDTSEDFKWAYINIPKKATNCTLFNIIVAKQKYNYEQQIQGDPHFDDFNDTCWFDEILFEESIDYSVFLNINKLKKITIPYEKVKITYDEYIDFLEYMENSIIFTTSNYNYKIEFAYQPNIDYTNKNNNPINLIATENINNDKDTLMSNVFNKMIFIPKHDFYFQYSNLAEGSEYESSLIPIKVYGAYNNKTTDYCQYFNADYMEWIGGSILGGGYYRPLNIYRDFIKWKYKYNTYDEYDNFIWSLILEEADILNFKLNPNDGSFTLYDTKMSTDVWWYNDNTNENWWDNSIYRNIWINENYMPLKSTTFSEEVNVYTDEMYNNGLSYNTSAIGLLNLSTNLNDITHHGIEKRLLPTVYIDGLKLFNECYYHKDLMNNCQDIYIDPSNVRSYFVDTNEFPFFSRLIGLMNTVNQNQKAYLKAYNKWIEEGSSLSDKPEEPSHTINLKDILSNIEVNTNFGLISEQEKLVAYIEVKDKINETGTVTRIVKSLNNETGAYFVSDYSETNINDDLTIDENNLVEPSENVISNCLNLQFDDQYIKNIINNNDRINIYISYRNDIGGKYARRINPKFVSVNIENQNINLQIRGLYTYEHLSTIYIVTGDINNHNMFFRNIDSEIEYIDLVELGSMSDGTLFKWLSYDTIVSSKDVEINMNGYILYPEIDYTIINSEDNANNTNLIMFRNKVPSNGNISVEINLRPDSQSKLVYKTSQAKSMCINYVNNSYKKVPIAKTITLDNDKYQFLSSTVNGQKINKFEVFINNMKVPNQFINIVNSKTINLTVNDKDYAIDMHKTHIAKWNENTKQYEITTLYNDAEKDNYRYFDPLYENILIVFQNKFNPYNYETEIANKYSNDNFASLLDNLFFRLEQVDKNNNLELTNSCYVPKNSNHIYDNFDWLCKNKETSEIENNDNTKVTVLNNVDNIINCNDDSLSFNISFDSKPIENNLLIDNILFDCNPIDSVLDNSMVAGIFKFNSFALNADYFNYLNNTGNLLFDTVYTQKGDHRVRTIVLYIARTTRDSEDPLVFERTYLVHHIDPSDYIKDYTNKNLDPAIEYNMENETVTKETKLVFKLIAYDEDGFAIDTSEETVYTDESGEIKLQGGFTYDVEDQVYDNNRGTCYCLANFTEHNTGTKLILLKEVDGEFIEANDINGKNPMSIRYYQEDNRNIYLPAGTNTDKVVDPEHPLTPEDAPRNMVVYNVFPLTPADFSLDGIRCKYIATTANDHIVAESEVFSYVPKVSKDFILGDKDPVNRTCTLIMYIGDGSITEIPKRVMDPVDETDTLFYKPITIEATCFNYTPIGSLDIKNSIIDIE